MSKAISVLGRNVRDWDQNLKKPQPKPVLSKEAISKGYAFPKCIENINPCANLRKLVDLLETPMSRGDIGRQLQLLDDFLDSSPYAFWLRDIPFVIRLLEAIVIKSKVAPKFREQLRRLFSLAVVPPMLTKQSDQLEYKRDFQHYFSVLGYLVVCIKDDEMKNLLLDAIRGLLTRNKPVGYCCVSLDYCKAAATQSDLPEIVVQLLEVASEDLYEKLLEITILLAEASKETCKRMIQENAVEFLLQRLEPQWDKRDYEVRPKLPLNDGDGVIMHCENSTRLLWLFIKNLEKGTNNLIPSESALWSLHYAFRTSVLNVGQRVDRNNLAAIILKLLQVYETIDIGESGIADDIALLSVASEIVTKNTWACPIKFLSDDKDYFFKRILITILPYLFKHGGIGSLKRWDVVEGLILVLKRQSTIAWHEDQYCELVLLAARVLSILANEVFEIYETRRIAKWILNFLKEFTHNRFDARILLPGLRFLYKVLPMGFGYFKNMKALNILLSLIKSILEEPVNIVTDLSQRCLAYGFYVLEHIYNKEFQKHTSKGVDLCLYLMKIIVDPDRCVINTNVIVSALHFLWDILEDSSANTRYFISQGGLYSLLDVIMLSNEEIKLPALGILAHACRKPVCIPYLITWRKQGKRIMSLLMQLFRGSANTVCTDNNKIQFASNQVNYLMNICHQRTMEPPEVAGGQFLDLCRPKVFCILKVFNKYKENVEIADESYKLFKEELTFEDQITKMVAKNFLSLKLCDAWIDLDATIKQDDILLLPADRENLDDLLSLAKKWKWHLKRLLEERYTMYNFREQREEVMLYQKLNESTVGEALDALRELKRVASGTERAFLLTKRSRKTTDLEKMFFNCTDENYHKTEPLRFPVAHVFDQVVEIESNKIHKEEDVIDFDLVSLDEDVPPGHDSDRDCLLDDEVLLCIDKMD